MKCNIKEFVKNLWKSVNGQKNCNEEGIKMGKTVTVPAELKVQEGYLIGFNYKKV